MLKSSLINAIAAKNGYSSYLEISTPTTGKQFDLIDRRILSVCDLAVYYIQDEDIEKYSANFKTTLTTSQEIVSNIASKSRKYDIVFVDPFHAYENSMEDIVGAFDLLNPWGVLIVHDCNPKDKNIAAPNFKGGGLVRRDILGVH